MHQTHKYLTTENPTTSFIWEKKISRNPHISQYKKKKKKLLEQPIPKNLLALHPNLDLLLTK